MFDPEYTISLYLNGIEALTQADIDQLSEWIEQRQENAEIFVHASSIHRAIYDALVGADVNKNVLLDFMEATGSDFEAMLDSNIVLEGVSVKDISLDEKEQITTADDVSIDSGILHAMQELARFEREAPVIEIHKDEPLRELIQKVVYPPREKVKMSTFHKFTFAACATMVLFFVYLHFAPQPDQQVVARVAQSVNAKWLSASGPITVGSDLSPGPLILKEGFAEIRLKCGARVLLEAPVEIDLERDNRLYLERGRLVANIEQSTEERFVVRTANSTVVDFGTEFGVEVDPAGQTSAHVFKGKIELRQGSDPLKYENKLALEAGQSGQAGRPGGLVRIPDRSVRFITEIPSRYELTVKKTSPTYYWRFDRDENGLLLDEMNHKLSEECKLYGAANYIEGPNMGGRRNRALHLTGLGEDYAILRRCSSKMDDNTSFSMAMWICPGQQNADSAGQENEFYVTYIKKIDGRGIGQRTVLGFSTDNKFVFRLYCPESETETISIQDRNVSIYSSPVQLNAWHHVVITYTNGQRMNLYVDGQLQDSKMLPGSLRSFPFDARSICWYLGSGTVYDSASDKPETANKNSFVGSVDEISQYSRELTGQEVRMLYTAALRDSEN
jgi:hypothetical protein